MYISRGVLSVLMRCDLGSQRYSFATRNANWRFFLCTFLC